MFKSTKTYGANLGLSATFRQWRANSHCQYLHGYALGFKFTFAATHLDERNWVVDFGGLKSLKKELEDTFDHKLVVAHDDPNVENFFELTRLGLAQTIILDDVGCEAFAKFAFDAAAFIVNNDRVRVISCECFEHSGNSAIYEIPFGLIQPIC